MFAIFNVFVRYFVWCIELHITPVFLVIHPSISFYYQADTSIFTQYGSTSRIVKEHVRARIVVKIENIATSIVITTTGRIHQAARIVFFSPCYDFRSLELSPCFIERNPYGDTRIRIQTVDDFFPLFAVVSFRSSRTNHFRTVEIIACLPLWARTTVRHILPYDQS